MEQTLVRRAGVPLSPTLRYLGLVGAVLGILTVVISAAAYAVAYPDSSVFSKYLSDFGATPGWPQVIFNSGMLVTAPLRYLFLILLVMRLRQLGARRAFGVACLAVGVLPLLGTIGMTAVPYPVNMAVHEISALVYFLSVLPLQLLISIRELKGRRLPVVLPLSGILVVLTYLVFATLQILREATGMIPRSAPVFSEWLAFVFLIVWLLLHSLLLGREDRCRVEG
jgi:hypothetical membrane protein